MGTKVPSRTGRVAGGDEIDRCYDKRACEDWLSFPNWILKTRDKKRQVSKGCSLFVSEESLMLKFSGLTETIRWKANF